MCLILGIKIYRNIYSNNIYIFYKIYRNSNKIHRNIIVNNNIH